MPLSQPPLVHEPDTQILSEEQFVHAVPPVSTYLQNNSKIEYSSIRDKDAQKNVHEAF
jgi:hypothetical protein